MRPFLERIDYSKASSFACRAFRPRRFLFEWHFHPEIELTLIGRGRGRRFVGNDISPFVPGDLVLLGSNLPHSWMSVHPRGKRDWGVESVVIQFRREFLGREFFAQTTEMSRIKSLLTRSSHGIQFSGAVRERVAPALWKMVEAPPLKRLTLLLEALDDLARCRTVRLLSSSNFDSGVSSAEQNRIQRIYAHVHAKYTEPIHIADLAKLVHRSPSALARFFRRMSGRSLTEYVSGLRIDRACDLLREEDSKIAAVAMTAGFENLSHFNRMFLRIKKMRPRDFRAAYREEIAGVFPAKPSRF